MDKKLIFIKIRLFFVKIIALKVYFAPDGLYYSINGKKGKPIRPKEKTEGKKFPFDIHALHVTNMEVRVYTGGSLVGVTYLCAALLQMLYAAERYLSAENVLDRADLRVLPCFVNEQATVYFSIKLFTSIAKFLLSLIHTKKGVEYAKRSNREYHG